VAPSVKETSSNDAEKVPSVATAKLCRAIMLFEASFILTMTADASVLPSTTAEVAVNVHELTVTDSFFALTGTDISKIRPKVNRTDSNVFFITILLDYFLLLT
jgi:hypothetical protein